jgi:NAD(P)H-dependent flavin oxidoreductase YrpB (nitropropane dioxygenase family)
MVEHPKRLGFRLGLKFCITPKGVEYKNYCKISEEKDVVYVALFAGAHMRHKKNEVIKVGQTGRRLKDRWEGTLGIFKPTRKKLRNNEREDRRKWLEKAKGKEVDVWVKKAGKIKYGKGLQISTRWSEEEFFIRYYLPREVQRLKSKETD